VHPSTALATVLIDEWVRCGVREVVLSPGSRSAPLAYAALAAHRAGRLRLHVRVDERTAGFLALGLAKVSRCPALVITTSGTAVANLHPAVLEASHACVPLIVMTADRPAELRGTGANQTTVQPGIFAGAVRFEHDQPPAEGRLNEVASWRSTVCRAMSAAVGRAGDPGPVHLNVALRDPLAPDLADNEPWPFELAGRAGGMPWVTWPQFDPGVGGAEMTVAEARAETHAPATTLMVLGDLPDPAMASSALRVAQAHGWPVIAEPFGMSARDAEPPSQTDHAHPVLAHGPLVLADESFAEVHRPQRVLVVGRHTLHRSIAALTRHEGTTAEHVSVAARWADPSHVLSKVYTWRDFMAADFEPQDVSDEAAVWGAQWHDAAATLTERIDTAAPTDGVAGIHVARAVLDELTHVDTLVLGSSNTPRDLNLADPAGRDRPTVVGNRGLSGIDGTISTAVGVALAATGGRVVALMGDLTLLHDLNGLLIGPEEPRPDLTIVVLNDDGGGIFATLEYGHPDRASDFTRLFRTSTGADLSALCAGMGAAHRRVSSAVEVASTLREQTSGLRVIEVTIDPATDQAARTDLTALAASGAARS